jgi:hypothetical protein
VNEKDGWMKMAAYGFTFSAPTVKVKLTQVAQAVATPSPTATTNNKTLTCVKGKIIKRVTAANPKCPAGYKKKAA